MASDRQGSHGYDPKAKLQAGQLRNKLLQNLATNEDLLFDMTQNDPIVTVTLTPPGDGFDVSLEMRAVLSGWKHESYLQLMNHQDAAVAHKYIPSSSVIHDVAMVYDARISALNQYLIGRESKPGSKLPKIINVDLIDRIVASGEQVIQRVLFPRYKFLLGSTLKSKGVRPRSFWSCISVRALMGIWDTTYHPRYARRSSIPAESINHIKSDLFLTASKLIHQGGQPTRDAHNPRQAYSYICRAVGAF